MKLIMSVFLAGAALISAAYQNEFVIMSDHTVFDNYEKPLPSTYIDAESLPDAFTWGDVDGVSFLTRSLNQHIPQYCGSCWAHGALSALADRIKIARGPSASIDINLSIQYILNCAGSVAGSCYGGSATGTYEVRSDDVWGPLTSLTYSSHSPHSPHSLHQFIKKAGSVPYDSCQPYIACSSDSSVGFCGSVDTSCSALNTCRTCSTFGVECSEIDEYPNATIAEFGTVKGAANMKAEIFARGPIACGINAEPILDYAGGVFKDRAFRDRGVNHIISIVGWGINDEDGQQHWIIRNSWGEYWGEMGYVRLELGHNSLGIESMCSWATPGTFTEMNFPCDEDGANCGPQIEIGKYVDPSDDLDSLTARLM